MVNDRVGLYSVFTSNQSELSVELQSGKLDSGSPHPPRAAGIPHKISDRPAVNVELWGLRRLCSELKFNPDRPAAKLNFRRSARARVTKFPRFTPAQATRQATSLLRSTCSPLAYPHAFAPLVDCLLQATRGACDSIGKTDKALPSTITSHGFPTWKHPRRARRRSDH